MKICVVGAGNIGLVLASTLALKEKYEVVIYTPNYFDISKLVFKDIENNECYTNLDIKIETSLENAISDTDYVFCTYPAFLRKKFIEESKEFYPQKCKLGFFSGYGGAEYMCKELVERGITIFGLQRVPFVARQTDKKIARCLSRKEKLFIAAIPKEKTKEICIELEELIGIPTVELNEYLAVTLVPSNPLLHLCGLYNVFKDYEEGDYFDRQLMFYDEWNDETSELLLDYDDELQEICKKMKPLNLEEIVSLRTYYESPTAEAMTKKLKSIEAFKVVTVPLIEKEGKFYILEMGYRFPAAVASCPFYEKVTGFNPTRWMIECALGIEHNEENMPSALCRPYSSIVAVDYMFAKSEGTITKIDGIETLANMQNVFLDMPKRIGGSTRELATIALVHVFANNCQELVNSLKVINESFKVYDEKGENILIYYTDYENILKSEHEGLNDFCS